MRLFTRDTRIDFIRGIAVISMIVQHVGGVSFLSFVFGAGAFYVSSAEVFVFLSGLVTARAALKTAERYGARTAALRSLRRAARLYALTIVLTLLALPLLETIPLPWAQGLALAQPLPLLWSVLTLHQTGYVVDIPLLYVLLMALGALVVPLFQAGHTRLVLLGSFGLWLAYQLVPEHAELPWAIAGNGMFPFSAWQALFCTGLTVGYHWNTIRAFGGPRARGWLPWAAGLTSLSFVLLFCIDHALHLMPAEANGLLFGKNHLGVGRTVATVAVLGFGYLLTAAAWEHLERWVGWFVLPLGRNSLLSYVLHVPAVYGAAILVHATSQVGMASREENTLLQLTALLVVWIGIRSTRLRPIRATPGRMPAWTAVGPKAIRASRALVLTLLRP